jgi:hypothetical protein
MIIFDWDEQECWQPMRFQTIGRLLYEDGNPNSQTLDCSINYEKKGGQSQRGRGQGRSSKGVLWNPKIVLWNVRGLNALNKEGGGGKTECQKRKLK